MSHTIQIRKRTLVIVAAALIVVAVVLAATVLNKAWWAKRINKKYNLQNPLTGDSPFVQSQSLRSLIKIYNEGLFIGGGEAAASTAESV